MPAPSSVPPDCVTVPTVSSPPSERPPDETVTAAMSESLLAPPVVSVPPATFTVVAAAVPLSVAAPELAFSVPAPRLALTVPPVRAYVAAVMVPPPPTSPDEMANEPTVSA